jgi:predicted nucleic acid-binding protein
VLGTAIAASAELIVSRDMHLTNLKSFHRIPIVTPTEALARISKANAGTS